MYFIYPLTVSEFMISFFICCNKNKSDGLDNSAGIEFNHKIGDHVNKGDLIFRYYNSSEGKLEQVKEMLSRAFSISEKKVESPELIYTA